MDPSESSSNGAPTVDELHDVIRELILTGELEAGAITSQVKLAERLGVGRTPLREALRMLQRERLIEAEYNRRVRVAPLSTEDLEALYSMRMVQEALAIRLSVPYFTSEDLAVQSACLAAMAEHAQAQDFSEWERHHRTFHQALVKYASARSRALVSELSDHAERYRRALVELQPITLTIGAQEHEGIAAACRARDAVLASDLLARHLGRTALSLISISDPTHDPAQIREALRLTSPPT